MALYQYTGRDDTGKLTIGKMKAESEIEVITSLERKKIAIISIKQLNELLHKDIQLFKERVKSQDFVIFIRQFSTLLKSGISLVDATGTLARQTTSRALSRALLEIETELNEGNPFSEAAKKHKNVFPDLFVNMLVAGEAGGNLDEILDRLAVYYEKQHITKQKVKSAMSYPVIVGTIALGVVVFLLTSIVPTFAGMFDQFGGEIPLITKIVLQAGDIVSKFWWLIILIVIGLISLFLVMKKNPKMQYYLDVFFLKIPVLGKILQKAAMARMTRTLSSLFASSVPILQAVEIVEKIVGNLVIERVLKETRSYLQRGESMIIPMERHWIFPPLVTQMIAVGEKTGALDSMLEKVADFYENEVDTSTEQLKSLIEPIMIVFLSIVVGGVVSAIAVPMFSIMEQIK